MLPPLPDHSLSLPPALSQGMIGYDEFARVFLNTRPDHIPVEHSVMPFLSGEVVASLYAHAGLFLIRRPEDDPVYAATSFASTSAVSQATREHYYHRCAKRTKRTKRMERMERIYRDEETSFLVYR